MTYQQAWAIQQGQYVIYQSKRHQVVSINVRGIAAPYLRLAQVGLVSYRLCRLAD